MRHSTNPWTEQENNQRYKLHQAIKQEFNYSPGKRTIYVSEDINGVSGRASTAVKKLRETFGYNVQITIGEIKVGATVRVSWEYSQGIDKKYRLDAVDGKKATITPLRGRWRKPRVHSIKNIYEV